MRHIMSKYDADRSGSVDLEEFTHFMSVGASDSDETAQQYAAVGEDACVSFHRRRKQ